MIDLVEHLRATGDEVFSTRKKLMLADEIERLQAENAALRRLNVALIKNAMNRPMNRPKDCPNCNTWAENEKLRAALVETHNAKVTGSPALSASPRGLPGYAGDNNGE